MMRHGVAAEKIVVHKLGVNLNEFSRSLPAPARRVQRVFCSSAQ